MHWLQFEEDVYHGDGQHQQWVNFGTDSGRLQNVLGVVLLFAGKYDDGKNSLHRSLSDQEDSQTASLTEIASRPTGS